MSYAGNAVAVAAKLAKKGQVVKLRKIITGDYNTATGAVNTSYQEYARNGLVLDYGSRAIDGTIIKQGDKQLYMEAGIIPEIQDRVIIGTVNYGVANIKELSPGGVVIMYELQLRQG